MFPKILVKRFENYLPLLVKSDQTGLVKNRAPLTNMRKLLTIIQFSIVNKIQMLIISLDAEKAFDLVEVPYSFEVLVEFGLGDGFINFVNFGHKKP